MMQNLWSENHPRSFWQCQPGPTEEAWQSAIAAAFPTLDGIFAQPDTDSILQFTLGEARFGPEHWRLSLPKRAYYTLKPLLPRPLTRTLRQLYHPAEKAKVEIRWPIESRYVSFLWKVLACVLQASPGQQLLVKSLWPENERFAFVLTHDVESRVGLECVRKIADLEERLGFRSSFNFVPERYQIDMSLVDELRRRGFEVGIHGLKHDGKLFNSRAEFDRRAIKINRYLKEFGAVGFRAPLTHRNPEWMQSLDIEYDLSFFDTDPYEPIPGGTMSIWPFFTGHFVELPYTLVQDYTLTSVLGETSPSLWLEKVDFIEKYHGMALLNSHPDYLQEPANLKVYSTFLLTMKARDGYWRALPREAAQWWRKRAAETPYESLEMGTMAIASLVDEEIVMYPYKELRTPVYERPAITESKTP
jgi:peptidoglycan/xylan/chitin deacetylase (PgdA/CDA1 family)